MSFPQFLSILLARWKTIAVVLSVAVAGAMALSIILPARYTATSTVVLDVKGQDPILGLLLPTQVGPGYLATQLDIILSHRVAREAVSALRLGDSLAVKQQFRASTGGRGSVEDWIGDVLLKNVEVRPARDSSVIDIKFTASDPQFAAAVANAWAKAYQKTSLELRVEPAKQIAVWFDERLKALRDNLETAQANLGDYQQKMGIVATDDRIDVENAKLGELTAQLVNAQSSYSDALSRQRLLKEFLARGADPESLPDVLANGLIQNLKAQLAQSEARFEQISSQLGRNHPEVQRLQADIKIQRERLRQEISVVAASITNSATIAEKREQELRSKVAEQKAKLLDSNQGRDEMAVLIKEMEAAQHAFDAASQRFTQTNLESQANQTSISVLNEAVPPLYPSFPKLWLNLIVGTVSGVILGVLAAIALEFVDRRIRSEEDVHLLPGITMLGSLEGARAKGFGRASWLQRLRPRGRLQPAAL